VFPKTQKLMTQFKLGETGKINLPGKEKHETVKMPLPLLSKVSSQIVRIQSVKVNKN